jgi:hypothetical protein
MAVVTVKPVSVVCRKTSWKYRRGHPPLFDGKPTNEVREMAAASLPNRMRSRSNAFNTRDKKMTGRLSPSGDLKDRSTRLGSW